VNSEQKYDLTFEESRTKSGIQFVMYVVRNNRRYRAGKISVYMDDEDRYLVESSYLNEKYRGKGLGKKLYTYALESLGILKTNYFEASVLAQHVWRSLTKQYKSRKHFFNGTLTLYNTLK